MSQLINDFQKQGLKFDINKLRSACDQVLKIKGFDTSLGIPHFAAIPLNQIPNDPLSIRGGNIRGLYWTYPKENWDEEKRNFITVFPKDYRTALESLNQKHYILKKLGE